MEPSGQYSQEERKKIDELKQMFRQSGSDGKDEFDNIDHTTLNMYNYFCHFCLNVTLWENKGNYSKCQ
jgi:hypothetical protein